MWPSIDIITLSLILSDEGVHVCHVFYGKGYIIMGGRFRAFLITAILAAAFCMGPVCQTYAAEKTYDITFRKENSDETVNVKNVKLGTDEAGITYDKLAELVSTSETQYTRNDISTVGSETEGFFDFSETGVTVKKYFSGTQTFVVRMTFEDILFNIMVTCREHKSEPKSEHSENDSDENGRHKHKDSDSDDVPPNPDALSIIYMKDGNIIPAARAGKQVQGTMGRLAFNQARPAGWKEAFAFNLAIDGKVDNSQKKGRLILYIPSEYQKTGRTFMILGLNKGGQVFSYTDKDENSVTVTVDLNLQGYAFDLIFKD